ncbi:MAG: hypothetical protein UT24_C0055G0006 [Candidatus Woesebacteria bacterium GW2011_GWB1_39_12]|uniref:Uncharacterized protein n=1 Tax=Candidatus Woesebacteria bacterium GW2011_GWB1_39_12 TaxID=1618574 RepID=A0A0G0M135_9BACT|nr:MAG: hypothetical protein UT24_C0055G0006 [Candidatus Woesebacteria bacterium GW2011_GWB1_39_12]
MKNRYLPLIFLICLHLFFLMNLQFTAWPEMLSYPDDNASFRLDFISNK